MRYKYMKPVDMLVRYTLKSGFHDNELVKNVTSVEYVHNAVIFCTQDDGMRAINEFVHVWQQDKE